MATHQSKHKQRNGTDTKELRIKSDSERYAEVVRATGVCRFECRFLDNSTTIAILKGSLKKGPHKQRITSGDFVLLQDINECHTEKDKYYIIHKYSPDEKKKLTKNGELTQIKTSEDIGTTIMMESEIVNKTVAETEINDDFIDNI